MQARGKEEDEDDGEEAMTREGGRLDPNSRAPVRPFLYAWTVCTWGIWGNQQLARTVCSRVSLFARASLLDIARLHSLLVADACKAMFHGRSPRANSRQHGG